MTTRSNSASATQRADRMVALRATIDGIKAGPESELESARAKMEAATKVAETAKDIRIAKAETRQTAHEAAEDARVRMAQGRVNDAERERVRVEAEHEKAITEPDTLLSVTAFDRVWKDSGSGGDFDLGIFRPRLPPGYRALGHLAYPEHDLPSGKASMLAVKDGSKIEIAEPLRYEEVWSTRGSDADERCAIWAVVPPQGFRSVGLVATTSDDDDSLAPPPPSEIVCVRSTQLHTTNAYAVVWFDKGTGARKRVSVWMNPVTGTFYAHRSWDRPRGRPMRYIKVEPRLDSMLADGTVRYVGARRRTWHDRGSGATLNVSFWRPDVPPGYLSLGDIPSSSKNSSSRLAAVIRYRGRIPHAPPRTFEKVWSSAGSGAKVRGAIWRPLAPRGYVAVGYVAGPNDERPTPDSVVCVHEDYALEARVGPLVWSDRGSGAADDVSVWINNQLGTFYAHASHDRPWWPATYYLLTSSRPAPPPSKLKSFGF